MTEIIVIDVHQVIASLEESYTMQHTIWGNECASIRAGFHKKTSRSKKNGKEHESTNWYMDTPAGGLKSVGKEEPDYTKYYPSEPKPSISFKFQRYGDHILLEEKDYQENWKLFKDCLAFPLKMCVNRAFPLEEFKSPRTGNRNFDLPEECQIKGGGDCENCAHDDCPDWVSVGKRGVSSARSSGKAGQKNDKEILSRSRNPGQLSGRTGGCSACKGQEYNIEGSSWRGFLKVCRRCGNELPFNPGCKDEDGIKLFSEETEEYPDEFEDQ